MSVFGAVPFIVGTPFPGTFIVDRDRRVTARFFEDFYRERSTVSRIMLRLGADTNPISGFEGSTAHLTVRAYQSNPEVAVGSLFVLGLDITPEPGICVYAPGASELGYPASEIYHFAPLDERIPVYQTRFTLLQDVVVAASSEAERALRDVEAITLTGQLEYQACNDTVCFDPVSVPLSWTVAVAASDRQRANRSP